MALAAPFIDNKYHVLYEVLRFRWCLSSLQPMYAAFKPLHHEIDLLENLMRFLKTT